MEEMINDVVVSGQSKAKVHSECKRVLAREHLIAFTKGASVSLGLFLASAAFYRTFAEPHEVQHGLSLFFAAFALFNPRNHNPDLVRVMELEKEIYRGG